jgi:hypothetical protein
LSEGNSADAYVRIDTICRGSSNMHIMCNLIESIYDILRDRVSSQSHTKIIICSTNQSSNGIFAFIIDFICTYVDVLELDILQKDPTLNFITLCVSVSRLFNKV